MRVFLSGTNWLLIISLIFGSAALAVLGDSVGSKYGKKRISLFGLRPKHTSRLITAMTGALIAVGILGVMSVFSQDVRTALFGMKLLRQQMYSLQFQLTQSEQNTTQMRVELAEAAASLDLTGFELDSMRNDKFILEQEELYIRAFCDKKECKNSDDKEIMNIFTLKIVATDRYGDEIKKLQSKYNKIINILKRNDSYFSNFFQTYLPILSCFLNKIPKTLNYFNTKILNNSFENLKSDLEEFDYFIFYIFNYDFVKNMDKINEIACSFEDFFIKEKNIIINEKIGDFKFNNNENILIQTDPCSHKIRLKDYNNYCFELIKKEKLKVNRYLNEQFFLFFKYQANNAFEKNKSVYKDFFKKIFKNNTIKNLFIYIFPYLEKNYFIR